MHLVEKCFKDSVKDQYLRMNEFIARFKLSSKYAMKHVWVWVYLITNILICFSSSSHFRGPRSHLIILGSCSRWHYLDLTVLFTKWLPYAASIYNFSVVNCAYYINFKKPSIPHFFNLQILPRKKQTFRKIS